MILSYFFSITLLWRLLLRRVLLVLVIDALAFLSLHDFRVAVGVHSRRKSLRDLRNDYAMDREKLRLIIGNRLGVAGCALDDCMLGLTLVSYNATCLNLAR